MVPSVATSTPGSLTLWVVTTTGAPNEPVADVGADVMPMTAPVAPMPTAAVMAATFLLMRRCMDLAAFVDDLQGERSTGPDIAVPTNKVSTAAGKRLLRAQRAKVPVNVPSARAAERTDCGSGVAGGAGRAYTENR